MLKQNVQTQLVQAITMLALGFLLAACGSFPYRGMSDEGFRYRAGKISAQHFIVHVSSHNQENNAVEHHALQKTAQLCAHQGYDWFEVITVATKNTNKQVHTHMEIWLDKGVRPDSSQAYTAQDVVDSAAQ